jgi:NADPH-dependent 2,4-dienoyl-CoA reductase/sulfur reductase-like enzyme
VSVLIVGGSVAGIATARALREYGYDAGITILEAEQHQPYDKPPLSKEMLLGANAEPVPLLKPGDVASLGIDLRLGTTATGLDPHGKLVRTDRGEIPYSTLVVATGAQPRTLPGAAALAGVHTLRYADDAAALRAALLRTRHLVIVGAGFIGSEIASAAATYGCDVTIVEAQDIPLAHVLGAQMGAEVADLHRHHGVTVLAGTQVAGFAGDTHVQGVALTDGRQLPADLVVIGVGVVAATGWLRDSGLPIDDGVLCADNLRVRGHPDIYVVGDVARREHPIYGDLLRIEHWTNAGELGRLAAATITGAPSQAAQLPYVWSELYGRRIQIVGRPALGHLARRYGSIADGACVAVYADDAGIAVGAVTVDDPRSLMTCRRAIMRAAAAAEITVNLPGAAGISLSPS